jgi:predicted amidohydrolase/ribosomal protein S18 acetylase RimI-like enzyme
MEKDNQAGAPKPRSRTPRAKVRLKDFEKRVVLRKLRSEDFDQLVAMQAACFPGMKTWTREQLDSQLRMFSDGQLCIEIDGAIVASSGSLIVDFAEYSEWHNWREIADNGFIRNHDSEGDTLYGIEIMVRPDCRGLKLARRLYAARQELCKRLNLARSIVGGRIPGYGKHADEMTARQYVDTVAAGKLYDPVLTTQLSNGFILKRLIPDYFPGDSESRGYATFLEWTNLDYEPDPRRKIQRVQWARICCVQYQMRTISSFEEFEHQCEFFVDTASDHKSDFVVFPELFTTQLMSLFPGKRPNEAALRLAELTPRYLEAFTQMAIKYHVNILAGSQFTHEGDDLYNVAYLFRRDGTLERQYKIHITPSERRWWGVRGGSHIKTFDTDRGKIAIAICYDVEFPELARVAAAHGARILFVPFNTDNREGYLRVRYCSQARAVENHLYVAIAGCVGNLPFVDNVDVHYGQSGIFSPCDFAFSREGIAAECMPNIETLVIHDVDLELLRRHRTAGTVQNWNDRRSDLYRLTYAEDGSDQHAI